MRCFSVWSRGSGQGRADPRPCVEFILEDDGRRFAIDACPVGVALRSRRGPAGPTVLHRTETALGDMAGQALVAKDYRQSQIRGDRLGPLAGQGGLRASHRRTRRAAVRRPAHRSRASRPALAAPAASPRDVARPPEGHERSRRRGVTVGQGDAHATLAEVDAQEPAHGSAVGSGVSTGHGLIERQRRPGHRASGPSTPSPARPRAAPRRRPRGSIGPQRAAGRPPSP